VCDIWGLGIMRLENRGLGWEQDGGEVERERLGG
jgi:hypothetical protein